MSDEIGKEGQTYHTHLYIHNPSGIRFSTVKKLFPDAHIEPAKGTAQQNRDYIFKEGKHEKTDKAETNLRETHEEMGECPVEIQGRRSDLENLYDMIKQGMSNYEIIDSVPDYMLHIDKIERSRQIIKEEKYKNVFRDVDVTYICGKTGTGKTRGVMESNGYENVFRITDYQHMFDNYKGQDVIVFEEFSGSNVKIRDMLNYLDGYPLELPCRYSNKIACYTKVYIISNMDLDEQYTNIQDEYPETWNALLRRIKKIKVYYAVDDIKEYSMEELGGYLPKYNEKIRLVK
jgi:hypothetical protein